MKLTISIDSATMTLVALAVDGTSDCETYNMNTGIAVAANLRQALASRRRSSCPSRNSAPRRHNRSSAPR